MLYNFGMNLILASNSPRRKDILTRAGYDFEIVPSNYDEKICGLDYSKELVENCAYNKALDVAGRLTGEFIIIGADTVVVSDNIILGKPKNEEDAFNMLQKLSDKTHFVATSVCIIASSGKTVKDTDKTFVTFRKLSDNDILSYIKHSKPLDKAGSYGIQDPGFDFAIKIEGELDNVIGFPLKLFKNMYELINQ